MTVRARVIAIACAVALLMAPVVVAQRGPGTAVTSHVVFTTSTGAAPETIDMTGLVARSNGAIVPIVDVAAAPPLSLLVIVDVTSSVSEAMVGFVWDGQGSASDPRPSGRRAADSPSALFLSPLLRGVVRAMAAGDRVRFGRVADVPELGPGFATDAATLGRAARWVVDVPADVRHGRTPIWDAVDMAVSALEAERGRRRAILLVTDGLSTGNRVGLDAVIERAAHADVAVFVVGEAWGNPRSARGWRIVDRTDAPWFSMTGASTSPLEHLQRLARATGGVFLADGHDGAPMPERRFRDVMNLLHRSYSVTVASPLLPGESATLSILSPDPGIEVHVRDRYRR